MAGNKSGNKSEGNNSAPLIDERSKHDNALSPDYRKVPALRHLQYRIEHVQFAVVEAFYNSLRQEREEGAVFNLIPVAMSMGIAFYFLAPVEPLIATAFIPIVLLLVVSRSSTRRNTYHILASIAVMLAGMSLSQLVTNSTGTQIIERQITGEIEGTILARDWTRRGAPRYLIRPHWIEGLDEEELPERLRVSSASKQTVFDVGDVVKGLARLQPVSGPVYPGGYDFSFFAYFEQMGGSGFFMGAPAKSENLWKLPISELFLVRINQARSAISKRIRTVLPGDTGHVAVALIIGDKTGIPEEVQASLRATGLAHILAISGLHMALVTLTIIWLVRLLCAFNPSIVLNHPVRKYAAIVGFVFATFYLGLSGAGVATQRAWIMISVMLCAVLLDRRAITMRSVAISAVIILVLNPQSLFSPGFQMSFAAVSALVAAYENINRHRRERLVDSIRKERGVLVSLVSSASNYTAGLATTSLVAGGATAFISAWHFHQVPAWGLLANILAMPLVSLIVMPFVLASLILLPFGYEYLALLPVHYGIEWTVQISQWVESFGEPIFPGRVPTVWLAAFTISFLPLVILRTKLRFLGILGAMPLLLTPIEKVLPEVLIAENGRAVAVNNNAGSMAVLFPSRENFVTQVWARSFGAFQLERIKTTKDACNKDRCIHVTSQSLVLHIVYDPELLWSSCMRADVLVAPRLRWVNCRERKPGLILKRGDFEERGSHAIYIERKPDAPFKVSYRLDTTFHEATRPWQRKITPLEDDISFTKQGSPERGNDQ